MKPKVMVVMGTRPEAIKMAPVLRQLAASEQLEHSLCVTAQHRDMLDQVLSIFDLKPDYDLDLMQPNQTLEQLTARVLTGMKTVYEQDRPDVVLVHGDTTTTFAAGLAAFYQRITIGHVEAGLRSFDLTKPFPEEMNRVLTDRVCRYHFAPTSLSASQLKAERISEQGIVITGNTAIDAVHLALPKALKTEVPGLPDLGGSRMILVTAHRRESFGSAFEDMCRSIRDIVERFDDVAVVYPVHLNPNVQRPVREILADHPRIHLIEPLPYLPFLRLMHDCHLVLTDSGGLQEEAPSLNKPVLVMRDLTERPEGIDAGVLRLVGTAYEGIVSGTTELLESPSLYEDMANRANPYGDGHAAERIVKHLEDDLCGGA